MPAPDLPQATLDPRGFMREGCIQRDRILEWLRLSESELQEISDKTPQRDRGK